jgi:DNA-binding transcriptional regulator LsrR (DeoR family)
MGKISRKSPSRSKKRKDLELGEPGQEPNPPNFGSDEFLFLVASLAWSQGLTANAIVKRVGLQPTAANLMSVKRALKRAHGKYLKLLPKPGGDQETLLDKRFNQDRKHGRKIAFHVVDDRHRHSPHFVAVAARAAELIYDKIRELNELQVEKAVVCNAGGRTVFEMVRALQRHPPADDVEDDANSKKSPLVFVAANAAYDGRRFENSANHLCVSLAQLFSGEHHALELIEDRESRRLYCDDVRRSDLLICGVGTREDGMMSQLFRRHHWTIPEEAAGDIAFNFIDRDGHPLTLPDKAAQEYISHVNPALDITTLLQIAGNKSVVLILDAEKPEMKHEIAEAVIRSHYATDVVMGVKLADKILGA